MRCGRLTARYSVCWSGVGWKLCEPNQDGRAIWLLDFAFLISFLRFPCG